MPEEQSAWDGMKVSTTSPIFFFFDIVTSCSSFLTGHCSLHGTLHFWSLATTWPPHECGFILCQWCGVRSDAVQPPPVRDLCLLIYNSSPWKLCKGKGSSWDSRALTCLESQCLAAARYIHKVPPRYNRNHIAAPTGQGTEHYHRRMPKAGWAFIRPNFNRLIQAKNAWIIHVLSPPPL